MAKKIWEMMQEDMQNNKQESESIRTQANQHFNDYISKNGAYDTNQHTYNVSDIKKNSSKEYYNNYKKTNNMTLWDTIQKMAVRPLNKDLNFNNLRGGIDDNKIAERNMENANTIMRMQTAKKTYDEAQKENVRNSLLYKQAKAQNPNATDKELLKIAKENGNKFYSNMIDDIASKNALERAERVKELSHSDSNPLLYDNNKFNNINNQVLQYKVSKEAQEEAEKINNGDSKAIGHILSNMPMKTLEAVGDPLYAMGSALNLKLPTATADQQLQEYKILKSKNDLITSNIDNGFTKTASQVSGTIGYMIPSILSNLIAPGSGRISQALSVGGSGYIDNLNEDSSNKLKSALTGVGKGYASYAIEGLTGGDILSKGSLDKKAVRAIASKTSKPVTMRLASIIASQGGEIVEELAENQVDYLIDKVVNDKGITLRQWLDEQGETVKNTAISTLITGMLGENVYNDAKEYKANTEMNKWMNEAQKIIDKENIKIDEDNLTNFKKQKEAVNVLKQLQAQESNQSLQVPNATQNQKILPTQQTTQEQNKVAENGNIEEMNRQKRMEELKSIDTSNMGLLERSKIKKEIRALEQGYNSIEEYEIAETERVEKAKEEYRKSQQQKEQEKIKLEEEKKEKLEKEIQESTPFKNAQYKIVKETNPMLDDYHTGIRSPKDIKTFDEVINDEESFTWGDFSKEDAQKSLEDGKITIYSSYPIENGVFVSTSKIQAEEYAGGVGNKIYSKEVPLQEVAWINGDEGQYAKVDNLANNQETLYNNTTLGKVRNVSIDEVLALQTGNGGNRDNEQISRLREDIKRKGVENEYERVNGNIEGTNSINAQIGINEGNGSNNSYESKEYGARTQNDRLFRGTQEIYNRPSSNTTYEKNNSGNSEIENSNKSSFLDENNTTKNTEGEKVEWNDIARPEDNKKFRKHYQSIIESSNTTAEAKKIARELMKQDTYIPESNKGQLQNADERISTNGADKELIALSSKVDNGDRIKSVDIAVGERLIEYYSKVGDKAKLQEAIQSTAMAGTQAGQTVQALALLNHQTPQGQVTWIQRSVNKMNKDLKQKRGEKAQQFDFTPEMQQKIMETNNREEMDKALNEVYQELGQQVSKSTIEQIDSWRYFAMLGNFRTHIRNMTGNFLMGITQDVKNKVAGAIEGTVAKFNPDIERTHTIKMPSKEVLEFAENDLVNVSSRLEGNKYTPKDKLQINMRTFKSDAMENTLGRAFNWNDNLLEAEDGLGLKSGYKKALAEYITANDIDIYNITDKQLSQARNYAVDQAKERTFHQTNTIASAINSVVGKNKATKAVGDAILPFVKTPANVAKTGVEYSPAGLAKTIVYDTVQLRKGNITVNQYIDNLSKGLTGSGITVLGYALAQAGILKATGNDDDKKEQFDEQSGKQAYSIQIGDKTYSIDWLAPVGIPLMVGAEIYEGITQKSSEKITKSSDDEEALNKFLNKAEVLTNSITSTLDPMVEMSMISGLVSSIKSFAQGNTEALSGMMTNMGKSYINQYIPTLLGQIAKTTDTVERDTTSTKSGTLEKAIDSTKNQVKSKVPILRQTLPTKKDIWGEEQKLDDNWTKRFLNAGILPMNIKQINNSEVVKELNSLYDKTGESSILPTAINKKLTINGQDYRLTNEEFNKYKTNYGKTSYNLIKSLVESKSYKELDDGHKKIAIENIYSYAKECNKVDYARNNNIDIGKNSTLYNTLETIKKENGNRSDYLSYLAKIDGIDGENANKKKMSILNNSNYSNKTKSIIYENTLGKDDKTYENLSKLTNVNMNAYLDYKLQDIKGNEDLSSEIKGKTQSGSKKVNVANYLKNSKLSDVEKLYIYGKSYKYNTNQKNKMIEYISNLSLEDRKEVYKDLSANIEEHKDGKYYWK